MLPVNINRIYMVYVTTSSQIYRSRFSYHRISWSWSWNRYRFRCSSSRNLSKPFVKGRIIQNGNLRIRTYRSNRTIRVNDCFFITIRTVKSFTSQFLFYLELYCPGLFSTSQRLFAVLFPMGWSI
jgi:hypothetical protein